MNKKSKKQEETLGRAEQKSPSTRGGRHLVERRREAEEVTSEPNLVWSTDFMRPFQVAGRDCFPLTVMDEHSRFLLAVQGLENTEEATIKPVYERAFREYGIPSRIRSVNRAPFASKAIGGLSMLSVWWVKLGITPERIEPGHLQRNGRHKRMHRTLKAEATRPPQPSLHLQQKAFDRFVEEYNEERPHEALGQKTPASVYKRSSREMPTTPNDPEYPSGFIVHRLDDSGTLSWEATRTPLANVLAGEAIGIEELEDGVARLWFGPICLGVVRLLGKGRVEFLEGESGG